MAETPMLPVLRPPKLRAGATIALVAPSRPSDPDRIAAATTWLEGCGYRVQAGAHIHDRYHYLAGRDDDRARHVMAAFEDDEVAGLLCVRGGFGTGRMIDRLDYDSIRRHPKAVIGFSDSTGLQLALYARTGLVTFTGCLADTDLGRTTVDPLVGSSLLHLLQDRQPLGLLPAAAGALTCVRQGSASGPLVAANLALLCSLLGTVYAPRLDGAVLLLEDVSEAPYRLDRMLTQLRLAGIFERISALVLGAFHDCFVPTDMAASPTLQEMVLDAVGSRSMPIVAGVAYGHMVRRTVLPMGILTDVNAEAGTVEVTESAVC